MAAIVTSPLQAGLCAVRSRVAPFLDKPFALSLPLRGGSDGCSPWQVPPNRRAANYRRRNGAAASSSLAEDAGLLPSVAATLQSTPKLTGIGTFRAGQKRSEVRVPALLLKVVSSEILERGEGEVELSALVDAAVAGGATMVVLEASKQDAGGAQLFEAACALKVLLRGRAQLLVAERADIAAAAGADGVLLSDQGLPAVVARRMMENVAAAEASVLPLIAKRVKSSDAAVAATAAEGADLLILESQWNDSDNLHERVTIPIICEAAAPMLEPTEAVTEIGLRPGCCGLALQANEAKERLASFNGDARRYAEAVVTAIQMAMEAQRGETRSTETESLGRLGRGVSVPQREVPNRRVLEKEAQQLVEEERTLLRSFLHMFQEATPQMAEITLLEDALARLDDLFLAVIVGEFNSGKSSVVNALLGKRFLKEGVVPTTNEITLLRHSDDRGHEDLTERHPDGHIVRFLPADLLKQMNLVDTPGTNVILERQQRLTEEFVPRADLVVFVLSADRPLTESEVSFLRYIREWGKKVVFVLNKSDVLLETSEVEEVLQFVADNVQRLLGVDRVQCFPVSARFAIRAKLAAQVEGFGGNSTIDLDLLAQDQSWQMSGFKELEQFIFSFLEGSSDAGAERFRLKLDTPLGVAAALLAAAERQLAGEAQQNANDRKSLQNLEEQSAVLRSNLELEAMRMHQRVSSLVESACRRAEQVVDATLRLGNVNALGQYLVTPDVSRKAGSLPVGRRFEADVVGSAMADLRRIMYEHRASLSSTCTQHLQVQCEFAATRWPQLAGNCAVDVAELREADGDREGSVEVLEGFDTQAAALLLDEELRQAVAGTFTSFGAAGVSASVLTSVLPSTVEDLLALALCTAGGYAQVLQLPSRREEVKAKVRKASEGLKARLIRSMEAELQDCVAAADAALSLALAPYREAVAGETVRVAELQARAERLSLQLRTLRQQVQNLGC